jgi:glycolate oxidase FAD binding subunit
LNAPAHDASDVLLEQVCAARKAHVPLAIAGQGSKAFYGRAVGGQPLDVTPHRGVVAYDPGDLVLTARAGTPLAELDALLAAHGQMLGFEPPCFGGAGTLGGAVAAGLAGPRRPHAGAVRDFVLGVEVIDGRGERVRFGGRVIKNVAGFDLARLMAGALGTLGVLLEVSLRVLPRPQAELTLRQDLARQRAQRAMQDWQRRPLPLSALAYDGRVLYARLSGTAHGVEAARAALGGEALTEGDASAYWQALRDHTHPFFAHDGVLWRLSVPAETDTPAHLPGDWLWEWGGAQRWLRTRASADAVRAVAAQHGGHAAAFRGGTRSGDVFHPLPSGLAALHRRLKAALDPDGLFNPGRLYPDL